MSSSTMVRTRAAKVFPAARLAAALSSKPIRSPSTATGRPARVAPARASAERLRPCPGAMIGIGAFIIAGSGRSWGRWSMKPASISHSRMSRPRCRKGTRPAGLVARTTRRPPASRSSAIWQPDWALPTTSTAPSGSWAGLR
jgi:hypothetical protein